jgi:F-type H+-transporting ATPase subunit a
MSEHHFNWLDMLGVPEAYNHVVMSAVVAVVLIGMTAVARGQLVRTMGLAEGGLVPEKNWTFKNFFEIIAESLFKLTESIIGHHDAPTYYPLVGTLFVFIFTSNILGLIPGFLPPTENMNTTLAFGLFVFIYYNWAGFKVHGIGYIKQFFGPLWWLAWLIFPIEVISHLFRPLSLALRLRGNIMGDHIVMGVFSGLVPYLLPVIFYGLGVFVAFIQAFVFCLMTMVYISLSISHDH